LVYVTTKTDRSARSFKFFFTQTQIDDIFCSFHILALIFGSVDQRLKTQGETIKGKKGNILAHLFYRTCHGFIFIDFRTPSRCISETKTSNLDKMAFPCWLRTLLTKIVGIYALRDRKLCLHFHDDSLESAVFTNSNDDYWQFKLGQLPASKIHGKTRGQVGFGFRKVFPKSGNQNFAWFWMHFCLILFEQDFNDFSGNHGKNLAYLKSVKKWKTTRLGIFWTFIRTNAHYLNGRLLWSVDFKCSVHSPFSGWYISLEK